MIFDIQIQKFSGIILERNIRGTKSLLQIHDISKCFKLQSHLKGKWDCQLQYNLVIIKPFSFIIFRDNYFVLTTNYDEHVLEEGFPEERVFEAHGNVNYFQW